MAASPTDTVQAEIARRVERLGQIFDLSQLADHGSTNKEIVEYYEKSRHGYRYVHSDKGAMHMALNPNGVFDRSGYEGQASLVEARFTPSTHDVLELACGNGYNLFLLASRHAEMSFAGIDLVEAQIRRATRSNSFPNVAFDVGDFQALQFPENSFDFVFVVESLCHATNLPLAFSEIKRVLRPGCSAVVIDAWRSDSFADAPSAVRTAAANVEQAMAVAGARSLGEWRRMAARAGFVVAEEIDLTAQIRPNLDRLARIADKFLARPRLAHAASLVIPQTLLLNAVAGYLLPLTIDAGVHTYRLMRLEHASDVAGAGD